MKVYRNYEYMCVGSSCKNNLGNEFNKYTIEMVGNDLFVIHDTQDGWDTATVKLETLQKLSNGEMKISEINWN